MIEATIFYTDWLYRLIFRAIRVAVRRQTTADAGGPHDVFVRTGISMLMSDTDWFFRLIFLILPAGV